jgi:hypothetical protein
MENNLGRCQTERIRHYQWRLIWDVIQIKKKISISGKFRSKRLFTPKLGACVDTVCLENRSKEIRKSSQWEQSTIGQLKKEKGWSAGSADGQKNSTLTVGQRVKTIGRWSTRGSADEEEEGSNQENTLEGKHGGGGSIYDWRRVKESVLGCFWLMRESFSIFSIFYL